MLQSYSYHTFVQLRYLIVKPSHGDIEMYSQDPKYNDLDVALLERLNVKVLKDPEAHRLVDQETFAFIPFWGDDYEILTQCHHRQPALHMGVANDHSIHKFNVDWVSTL